MNDPVTTQQFLEPTPMTADPLCPKCQSPLPADAPAGICPKCLFQKGLQTTVGLDVGPLRELQEGETLGSYRLDRRLGSGGMGVVFAATHAESGRHVALKVLNHRLESPEHRLRFLREGRMAASVNHPHSVYVFGTEEIGGVPVIAMEMAPGGTLQERVSRDGPLAEREAVDMVLQIIDGLEAAEAVGVLHRDIKPSNCFLDEGGAVKIGDFGLSISKMPRGETNLTQTGVFLGTPAFSSPEQLRGDELDARSDIYSVGATLFYLLSGHVPFEAKQMVQFLATVLEKPAPSVTQFNSNVSSGLAQIVQRCLAKRSNQRFRNYAELREALLPYSSAAQSPATLGLRALAYLLDSVIVCAMIAVVLILWADSIAAWSAYFDALSSGFPSREPRLLIAGLLGIAWYLIYFAVQEGVWGITAGKAVCRLRLVSGEQRTPGLARGLARTFVFHGAYWLPCWALFGFDLMAGTDLYNATVFLIFGCIGLQLALFLTVGRSNGYSGLHDLLTGLRVVRIREHQQRPALEVNEQPEPKIEGTPMVGPYHVLGPLLADSQQWLLGYDTRLLRKVWLRMYAEPSEPLSPHLREVSRIGRLRWLNGHRDAAGGWDAYEAPSGQPLLQTIAKPRPWGEVRFWLLDLATELKAATIDDSLPAALEVDRVWITADGRAKLLDFRAPTLMPEASTSPNVQLDRVQSQSPELFLKRVAIAALEGPLLSPAEAADRRIDLPLPLSARAVLNKLGSGSADTNLTADLKSLTGKPAEITSGKLGGIAAACWLVPLAFAGMLCLFFYGTRQFLIEHPEVGVLAGHIDYYHTLTDEDPLRESMEIVIAHRFGGLVDDAELWSKPGIETLVDSAGKTLVESFVQAHRGADQEVVAAAQARIAPEADTISAFSYTADMAPFGTPLTIVAVLVVLMLFLLVLTIIPSMLLALIVGDSPLLRALDLAVVDKRGRQVSRLQLVWRNALLWTMVLVGLSLMAIAAHVGRPRLTPLIVVYGLVRLLAAQRGLHDRLAGTYVVPR